MDAMAETLKKHRAETFERINVKVQALAWVVIASVVVYYTDFFNVMFHDSRVDRCVPQLLETPPAEFLKSARS